MAALDDFLNDIILDHFTGTDETVFACRYSAISKGVLNLTHFPICQAFLYQRALPNTDDNALELVYRADHYGFRKYLFPYPPNDVLVSSTVQIVQPVVRESFKMTKELKASLELEVRDWLTRHHNLVTTDEQLLQAVEQGHHEMPKDWILEDWDMFVNKSPVPRQEILHKRMRENPILQRLAKHNPSKDGFMVTVNAPMDILFPGSATKEEKPT